MGAGPSRLLGRSCDVGRVVTDMVLCPVGIAAIAVWRAAMRRAALGTTSVARASGRDDPGYLGRTCTAELGRDWRSLEQLLVSGVECARRSCHRPLVAIAPGQQLPVLVASTTRDHSFTSVGARRRR